jgi:hypothetical protein
MYSFFSMNRILNDKIQVINGISKKMGDYRQIAPRLNDIQKRSAAAANSPCSLFKSCIPSMAVTYSLTLPQVLTEIK